MQTLNFQWTGSESWRLLKESEMLGHHLAPLRTEKRMRDKRLPGKERKGAWSAVPDQLFTRKKKGRQEAADQRCEGRSRAKLRPRVKGEREGCSRRSRGPKRRTY